MFKLPHNCTHFTGQHHYSQNFSIQPSAVHELRTSRCRNWVSKRQRNQKSNCQHSLDHREIKGLPEKHLLLFLDYTKAFVQITTNCRKVLKGWKYQTPYLSPEKPVQGSRSTIRTRNGKIDWFQIGKELRQDCIFSPHLFTFYAELLLLFSPSSHV